MSDQVKRMAELLKGGAKMLASTCPECGTILFQVGGDIICPRCNKRIIIAKNSSETEILDGSLVLHQIERTVTKKIDEIQRQLSDKNDPKELVEIATLLSIFLEVLERIKRIRGSR